MLLDKLLNQFDQPVGRGEVVLGAEAKLGIVHRLGQGFVAPVVAGQLQHLVDSSRAGLRASCDLGTYDAAPCSSARTASSSLPCAVISTTGTRG